MTGRVMRQFTHCIYNSSQCLKFLCMEHSKSNIHCTALQSTKHCTVSPRAKGFIHGMDLSNILRNWWQCCKTHFFYAVFSPQASSCLICLMQCQTSGTKATKNVMHFVMKNENALYHTCICTCNTANNIEEDKWKKWTSLLLLNIT